MKEQKAKIKSNVNSVLVNNTTQNQTNIPNERNSVIIKSGNRTSRLSTTRRSKTMDINPTKVDEIKVFFHVFNKIMDQIF